MKIAKIKIMTTKLTINIFLKQKKKYTVFALQENIEEERQKELHERLSLDEEQKLRFKVEVIKGIEEVKEIVGEDEKNSHHGNNKTS